MMNRQTNVIDRQMMNRETNTTNRIGRRENEQLLWFESSLQGRQIIFYLNLLFGSKKEDVLKSF